MAVFWCNADGAACTKKAAKRSKPWWWEAISDSLASLFLSHCTGSKVNPGSVSLQADMVSGLYKVLDMLLRSCWPTRAWTCPHTHTCSHTLINPFIPPRWQGAPWSSSHTHFNSACVCVRDTDMTCQPQTDHMCVSFGARLRMHS